MNQTFVLIKHDAVERKLVGEILRRFEQRNFNIVRIEFVKETTSVEWVRHYIHLKDEPFFNALIERMSHKPCVLLVLEGINCQQSVRNMLGATDPSKAAPGTIRGDFASVTQMNVCHASDSEESVEREINIWFD